MNGQLLLASIVFGLSAGSIFFLLSVGLSLCFGLMRIISLDQLLYYSVGAYLTYSIITAVGSFWVGMVIGMIGAAVVGLIVERFVFNRVYEKPITFSMVTSFGVLLMGIGAIQYIWGVIPKPVASPIAPHIHLLGADIPVYRLVVIAISLAVYGAIWLFLNRSIVGKAIRAGIEDAEKVEGLGINIYRLFAITFIIAAVLSALAGTLNSPMVMVGPEMGLDEIPFVFMVVIIGGLGSIKGTLISSFIVGEVTSLGALVWTPLSSMAPFAIMLIILLIRPTGLYGSPLLKR